MSAEDLTKLEMLLEHWVEHNREHSQEFVAWAARARELGKKAVADKMMQAARAMDESGDLLVLASEMIREED